MGCSGKKTRGITGIRIMVRDENEKKKANKGSFMGKMGWLLCFSDVPDQGSLFYLTKPHF